MADRYGALRTRAVEGRVHRIVPSRFPPVDLFDVARSAEELLMLAELEGLTNERMRQLRGELQLVPAQELRVGPGTTPIMAAFCHPTVSRFSDGAYGVYYAGLDETTAILETVFHRERFLREAHMPVETLEMRRYTARVVQPMTTLPAAHRDALLDPDDYRAPQAFGLTMRERRVWGIYYPSVRHKPEGRCVAILRPTALSPVTQASHYRYWWNGSSIERVERIEEFRVQH